MRSGKRRNILSFKATEKAYATVDPKKRFPMFIDHRHFLTERAGWKLTKVHPHYTFEQKHSKRSIYSVISVVSKKQRNEVMMCK